MRICAHPGCPTPVERPGANRCPTHDPGPRTRLDRTPRNPGVPARLRQRVYRRDRGICHHCGIWCPPRAFHADHWPIARTDGGPTTEANLVVSCQPCNERHGRQLGAHTTNHPE